MLDLAARPNASPEVRASVYAHLESLRRELKTRHPADSSADCHVRLAERDLTEFQVAFARLNAKIPLIAESGAFVERTD